MKNQLHFLFLTFFLVCSTSSFPQAVNGAITDAALFAALNLDYPGMENVKAAVAVNDYVTAKQAYQTFRRTKSTTVWPGLNPASKPTTATPGYNTTAADRVLSGYVGPMSGFTPPDYYFNHSFNWKFNPVSTTDPTFTNEWVYSLNRFNFWSSLRTAYWGTLDEKYALTRKITGEPGLEEIIKQLAGRILKACGSFSAVKGKRILDIACGSSTSKAPSSLFVNTPFGEGEIEIANTGVFAAQFEPWFCRILSEFGADSVGIDLGNLDGETFEHYHVDLGQRGALNFLPDHSFDAVHDSRLFGSPEFSAQFPYAEDRLKVAVEIWRQEQRLLKAAGIGIHSDAAHLIL